MDLSSRSSRDLSFSANPSVKDPQIIYEGCSDNSGIKSLIDSTIESMFTDQFSKPNEFTLKRLRYDYEYKSRSVNQNAGDEEPIAKKPTIEVKNEIPLSVIKSNAESDATKPGVKVDIINFKKKWIKRIEAHQSEDEKKDSASDVDSDDEIKPFLCGVCNSRFRHLTAFTKHKLTHTPQPTFNCSECDFTCKQSGQLATHKLTHSKVKVFTCSQCSYTCKRANNMKTHKMMHEGKKPFACTQCDSTFLQASHLKKHNSTHATDKPISCSECSFTCKMASLMKTHQLTHGELKK